MHYHLIGVAGTAMTSLARLLLELGHRVTGSDEAVYPPMSTELERLGVDVQTPYAAANLTPSTDKTAPDRVVVGNAIPRGNPELEECLDRNLAYTSQAEVIEDVVLPGRVPIVVTGTHGKTTTSTLIASMLVTAGRDPGWFIGGVPHDLPSTAALGSGAEIVLEGDEYDTAYFDKRAKFHHYRPRVLVVNNLEYDHADIYPDLASIEREFRRLVNTVPRSGLIAVGAASKAALAVTERAHGAVVSYGIDGGADLTAHDLVVSGDGVDFVVRRGDHQRKFHLGVPGEHNVLNALAALAVADHLDLDDDAVRDALARFRGVRRRLELVVTARGISLFDDFAHHPTAIRQVVAAVRARTRGRLWAIVEPRSWSMRRNIHQETLPRALAAADRVLIAPIYDLDRVPAGLALDLDRVVADLRDTGTGADIADNTQMIDHVRREAHAGDNILVMSNGGFGGLVGDLRDALTEPTTKPS